MGSEDYLFLPAVKKVAQVHIFSRLKVIQNCGHVVNIEKPKQFNEITIKFIDKLN